jgi:hypothetical protein
VVGIHLEFPELHSSAARRLLPRGAKAISSISQQALAVSATCFTPSV